MADTGKLLARCYGCTVDGAYENVAGVHVPAPANLSLATVPTYARWEVQADAQFAGQVRGRPPRVRRPVGGLAETRAHTHAALTRPRGQARHPPRPAPDQPTWPGSALPCLCTHARSVGSDLSSPQTAVLYNSLWPRAQVTLRVQDTKARGFLRHCNDCIPSRSVVAGWGALSGQ